MMLYTKYESPGPCSFRQKIDPVTYLCNQSELFEQFLKEDYPGTIPVEFGQIPISGSR